MDLHIHPLLTAFKISFYLVPPVVFSFRVHAFFHLEPIRRLTGNGTCVTLKLDNNHMNITADVFIFKIYNNYHKYMSNSRQIYSIFYTVNVLALFWYPITAKMKRFTSTFCLKKKGIVISLNVYTSTICINSYVCLPLL